MSNTFKRVYELCYKQGISINNLEEKLGLGKNSLYGLKKGNPNSKIIQKIADYFHVSTDFLLDRTNISKIANENNKSDIEIKRLAESAMFFDGKPVSDDEKKAIQGIVEGYLNTRR